MQGLGGELRRLGIAQGQANRAMAKAIDKARETVEAPKEKPIATARRVTMTTAEEKAFVANAQTIVTAYKNGLIDEAKAAYLMARI